MVATASSAAADISSQLEVHNRHQFSANTEPVHNSVGVAVRLGSDGSTGNRSESPNSQQSTEEHCAPMDLSSGGVASQSMLAAATPTLMMAAVAAATSANNATPPNALTDSLLNARRLAEFVRAQQLRNQNEEANLATPPEPKMVPRKRAWPELQLDLSAMVSEKLKKKEEPSGPVSPAESSSSGGGANSSSSATPTSNNKEVKKRRLDQLLSQKFSVNDSPPPQPEIHQQTEILAQQMLRRDSTEKKNRRKRASPVQSSSPVTLSLRPNSELLQKPAKIEKSEEIEEHHEDTKSSTLKNQLLQLHLAQAALLNQTNSGLFPGFPSFPTPTSGPPAAGPGGANPLLYYGYYAQMIQGLQSQQQKLLEQLTGGKTGLKNSMSPLPMSSTKVNLNQF